MAVKPKHAEEKVKKKKKRAVNTTASKKSQIRTNTIEVIVEKKPNLQSSKIQKQPNNRKIQQKSTASQRGKTAKNAF